MKTVLITGANKGIGFETARQLAQSGYFVYLGSRDRIKGLDAINKLNGAGISNVAMIEMDVTNIPSIKHAKQELENQTAVLDVLINNAGIAGAQPLNLSTGEMENLRRVFETNFFGAVQTTQQFLDLLKKSKSPCVINVSSELGSLTLHSRPVQNPNWNNFDAYSSSKTALNAFTVMLASEFHRFRGLPRPEHPLISVINYESVKNSPGQEQPVSLVLDYYSISLKRNIGGKIKYGQQEYDFDEGTMFFISPGQVFSIEPGKEETPKRSGWMLLVHPDFLWHTPLAKTIKRYEYFDYSVHEALFLSEKEEATITNIVSNIGQEYHSNIDKFSQDVIIAQLELLLTYSERFHERQFITRKISNNKILDRLEDLLTAYFNSDDLIEKRLPSVQYIAGTLNVSPNYLSGLLKVLTGQSTQQHIHDKLIEKAKEKLSTTDLTVSEIAYALGFEHPQYFSKLFKTKTNYSPLEFRQSFN